MACRGVCHVDNLLVLSKAPLEAGPSGQSFARPELYALALVDRAEPDPQQRSRWLVHAQLNLRTAGALRPCPVRQHARCRTANSSAPGISRLLQLCKQVASWPG